MQTIYNTIYSILFIDKILAEAQEQIICQGLMDDLVSMFLSPNSKVDCKDPIKLVVRKQLVNLTTE